MQITEIISNNDNTIFYIMDSVMKHIFLSNGISEDL